MRTQIQDFALFGKSPVFSSPHSDMSIACPDERIFFELAQRCFQVRQLTNNGPLVTALESQLAQYHDVEHCICCSSAFSGIILAIRALAVPFKTEIIIPSLVDYNIVNCLKWAGFTPHFCDVDAQTLAIDVAHVEESISPQTALVLASHPRVYLCDLEALENLSKVRGIPLLFDSAEACGCVHNGKKIGSFGNCEVFSLHSSKFLNASEGGYITTNDGNLAAVLRSTRSFGFVKKDDIQHLGHNAKLNELHAALGLASFARADTVLSGNEVLHKTYQKQLADLPGFTCLPYETHEKRNWCSLLIRLDERWPFSLAETLDFLNAENISARAYYSESQHKIYHTLLGSAPPHMPVTDWASQHYLTLPFGCTVSLADTEIIAEVLHDINRMHDILRNALRWRGRESLC